MKSSKKLPVAEVRSHPRNYFQKTGIGSTQRKFGYFSDINWKKAVIESQARKYCQRFIREVVELDGYLDTAFSTANPMYRSYQVKEAQIGARTSALELFGNRHPLQRVPFRAVLGISSGADSTMTSEILCRAVLERRRQGIRFATDQILLVSLHGRTLNKVDSKQGEQFAHYLQRRYPDLPIQTIKVRTELDHHLRALRCALPVVPEKERTSSIFIPLDFHRASLLNQLAEAYNFLHVDTTNRTEEALGETTDGTGGFGHVSVPYVPKSMIYRVLDLLEIPRRLGRNAVDSCTNQNKMEQYLSGRCPRNVGPESFFDIMDRVILMFTFGYTVAQVVKETGHKERFIRNVLYRMYLALHRGTTAGYPFLPGWSAMFKASVDEYATSFHYLEDLRKIFRIRRPVRG